jgi:thiosulfate/3-mercaptopyruvate sulfurtransferase
VARVDGAAGDPWSQSELIEPAALVKELGSEGKELHIICVSFPFLYRRKHIQRASFAGPADKREGIAQLRSVAESLPKNASIVIYCGCCPMDKCPNIRPAYRAVRERGFEHVRVLNLSTNLHTDWTAKGYPVEP